MQLGHCICDPRRSCPCDVFRNQGFCPCAGERPDASAISDVRLTSLVRNLGCASKIPAGELEAVLSRLPAVDDPAVISGLAAADDAAIYRLTDRVCLVQTVDVFTPCVDDPRLFGRICAANCLSDIYAMGGEPRTALSVLAFPSEKLPGEVMLHMLSGAMEKLKEANVALVGGHSIKDDELKLGFAITGTIDVAVAAALDAPQPGDLLVLTKPLGTGVLAFAGQVGRGNAAGMDQAVASMTTLNRAAAEAMREAEASACTDITGFGLFGHLVRMMRQHSLTARIAAPDLPAFDGVLDLLHQGVVSGGIERNREFVGADLRVGGGVDDTWIHLGCDPQTSGGLLIAIAPAKQARLEEALRRRGVGAHVIGVIKPASSARIIVDAVARRKGSPPPGKPESNAMNSKAPESHQPGCCADVFGAAASSSTAESQRSFAALMRSVQGAGVLTERTKELVLFGLVVQNRCAPCFEAHYRRACELGITRAELDEVAWCAVAMGGAPVKMFYQESIECMGDERHE